MSLHALQCALAELFTDIGARNRYDRDSAAFGDAFDLNDVERAQLATLAQSAIASYAAALVCKRRAEASRLLPNAREALGERFSQTFSHWASRMPLGEGPERYRRDAAAFCNHLLRDVRTRELTRAVKSDLALLRL